MRLITRADLDGLTCAVFLHSVEDLDEILFREPYQLPDPSLTIGEKDIIANLPFQPGCGLWFDHHATNGPELNISFRGAYNPDPSAARTIYNYYRDARLERFLPLLEVTDKVDSADLTLKDVLAPTGGVLLSLTLDPRSGLPMSDDYARLLIDALRSRSVEETLMLPEVASRCRRLMDGWAPFEAALRAHSRLEGRVIVTDFRPLRVAPVGSRFLVYAIFPEATASVRVSSPRAPGGPFTVSIAHSLFHKGQTVSAGKLCQEFGGGGHVGAGSAQVDASLVDAMVAEAVSRFNRPDSVAAQ